MNDNIFFYMSYGCVKDPTKGLAVSSSKRICSVEAQIVLSIMPMLTNMWTFSSLFFISSM